MKKFLKILLVATIAIFSLGSCSISSGNENISDTAFSTFLDEKTRYLILEEMLTAEAIARDYNYEILKKVTNEEFLFAVLLSVLSFTLIITIVFMCLRARNRNMQRGYDIVNKILEKNNYVLDEKMNAEFIKSLMPYNQKKKKSPYVADATTLAVGLSLVGLICSDDFRDTGLVGIGFIILLIGAARLITHIVLAKREKKENDNKELQ
ncbi:MAG: hypothetical protein II296_03700 [Bacteroidaceae bacterium]|nr:hypothetical protein [Bacteroidaceae bacterium]